ncbi:hypothetical protein M5X17_31075 [Paenibacillus alvei]|uniref:hypothetical protein n=1 Tax=Paenibacillus alvei TaxID=44250 RepID=UPI00227E06C0|nr:hypothetical protein [Paenibacillus alvei]MCY9738136.1 hypothetical protein [Paenibacillus alvei]
MKKIMQFLKDNKYECRYINTVTKSHYGGKSFYNDGTFKEDVYEIKKDNIFHYIHHKSTGRPQFLLYNDKEGDNILLLSFSQNDFITQLQMRYLL